MALRFRVECARFGHLFVPTRGRCRVFSQPRIRTRCETFAVTGTDGPACPFYCSARELGKKDVAKPPPLHIPPAENVSEFEDFQGFHDPWRGPCDREGSGAWAVQIAGVRPGAVGGRPAAGRPPRGVSGLRSPLEIGE